MAVVHATIVGSDGVKSMARSALSKPHLFPRLRLGIILLGRESNVTNRQLR